MCYMCYILHAKPLNIHSPPGPCYMCYICYILHAKPLNIHSLPAPGLLGAAGRSRQAALRSLRRLDPGLVQQLAGTLDLYSMQIRASAFEGVCKTSFTNLSDSRVKMEMAEADVAELQQLFDSVEAKQYKAPGHERGPEAGLCVKRLRRDRGEWMFSGLARQECKHKWHK